MNNLIKYGLFSMLGIFSLTACSNMDENAPKISQDVTTLYEQTFATGLGDFTAQSVSGDQVWANAGTYVMITGYVNPTNYANEDWLISPVIDLTKEKAANLSFQHVVRYFANVTNEATVWVSTDYVDGLPSTGTWTQLHTSQFVDYGSWTFIPSGEISLTAFAGKKIRIAFKYISTASKAGTWELQNVVVKNSEAVVVTTNMGLGTEVSPYTVSGGVLNQSASAWVKGTIVGYVWSGAQTSFVFGADTCTQATNILIADSANNIYLSKTLPVQLPTGAIRNGLNLVTNKSLIGKKVKLYGDLVAYFGVAGLKNVVYYEFEDGTKGGLKPFDPTNAIYYETFATSLGAFTAQSVSGAQAWTYNATYKCAYMTGYVSSKNNANEDWLISPPINLKNATASMSFVHAGNYFTASTLTQELTVWISTNYTSGAPSTATWTQLTIPNHVTNTDYTFVNSGDINLNAYVGKNVNIAFKYISTATKAGTWEIKNFMVK